MTGFSPLSPRDAFALQVALTVGRLDPVVPVTSHRPDPDIDPGIPENRTNQR